MKLEVNLDIIKKTAKAKLNENNSFQKFLLTQNKEAIDAIVAKLNNKVTSNVDCVECGNCCMNLRPIATNPILSQFLKPEDIETYKYAEFFTCCHLYDKKCAKYLDRPQECRDFPYMDRPNFINRTQGILQNYEICPIVFNIFEMLKEKVNWTFD